MPKAAIGRKLGLHQATVRKLVNARSADDVIAKTRNLRRDFNSVQNGLSLPHSSGAVEGNINRLKMLKRQMFGRAGLDLLRKRVLLAR